MFPTLVNGATIFDDCLCLTTSMQALPCPIDSYLLNSSMSPHLHCCVPSSSPHPLLSSLYLPGSNLGPQFSHHSHTTAKLKHKSYHAIIYIKSLSDARYLQDKPLAYILILEYIISPLLLNLLPSYLIPSITKPVLIPVMCYALANLQPGFLLSETALIPFIPI